MKQDSDSLYRFLFERTGVRGELVYLDASFRAVLERHPYPGPVQRPLGEALAAVLLLTATLKFEGSLILQARGKGPLRTLVTQATHNRTVRGLARWSDEVPYGDLEQQFGDGHLVLTLDPLRGERYQGIVPLQGRSLRAALEAYFGASEQLPTRLWLAVDGQRAAGMMLQQMPGNTGDNNSQSPSTNRVLDHDGWHRTTLLADTLSERELLDLKAQDLLLRLFHEEEVRLFEPEPVAFRCSCSRIRIADTLRAIGRTEVDDILEEQGSVGATCEFCNRNYRFDAVDVQELFAESVIPADIHVRQH